MSAAQIGEDTPLTAAKNARSYVEVVEGTATGVVDFGHPDPHDVRRQRTTGELMHETFVGSRQATLQRDCQSQVDAIIDAAPRSQRDLERALEHEPGGKYGQGTLIHRTGVEGVLSRGALQDFLELGLKNHERVEAR